MSDQDNNSILTAEALGDKRPEEVVAYFKARHEPAEAVVFFTPNLSRLVVATYGEMRLRPDGHVEADQPYYMEFEDGSYRTDNPREIAFLRGHKDYKGKLHADFGGSIINVNANGIKAPKFKGFCEDDSEAWKLAEQERKRKTAEYDKLRASRPDLFDGDTLDVTRIQQIVDGDKKGSDTHGDKKGSRARK